MCLSMRFCSLETSVSLTCYCESLNLLITKGKESKLFLKKSFTHCILFISLGILNDDGSINNAASIKRMAEISLSYAKAGMKIEW